MSHFRIRFVRYGGHTHLDVYGGKSRHLTHGKCGELTMTNEEFDDFISLVKQADIEFFDNELKHHE